MRILLENEHLALFTLEENEELLPFLFSAVDPNKIAVLYNDPVFVPYKYRHTNEVLSYFRTLDMDLVIISSHADRLLLTHRNKKDRMIFKLKYGV